MAEPTTPLDMFQVQDPAALRAIAHPLRQRILMELSVRGHARAADLAQVTGQPANTISFHLRMLAKAGMIVEAPEHARDKRDRVWTNVASSYRVPAGTRGEQEILGPAIDWLSSIFGESGRPAGQDGELGKRAATLNVMLLTTEEASALADELTELLMRWSDETQAEARANPGVARDMYQVLAALGPREYTEATPDGEQRDS